MDVNTILAPCDAELIQTACRRAHSGTLSVSAPDGAATEPKGCDSVGMVHLFESDAFLLVPDETPALRLVREGGDVTAMVEVIDVAPVRMRERVRSLIWLSGTLHEVPARLERDLAVEIAGDHPDEKLLDVGHGYSLMRMALESAVIATSTGAGGVDVDALAAASPDLFWEFENDWLVHLDADHQDLICQLAQRLPDHVRGGRARPLRLDRFGITFRVEVGNRDEDVRMPFARPVSRIPELSAAIHSLALHPCFGED
ncbi:DUF2470 domain-containing protein [Gordonia sihwensis]|uniref:DUF2470 domain-containing protein n=1 Tax=Gordonia sihwensis TaxID=173559 RepID=UPI001C93178B|nr:DUF2470 domain-containing protein [Gordonia sihwensis]MBY4570445.1 DUF2470 domain-containing protein [Gordonia sihwensis]